MGKKTQGMRGVVWAGIALVAALGMVPQVGQAKERQGAVQVLKSIALLEDPTRTYLLLFGRFDKVRFAQITLTPLVEGEALPPAKPAEQAAGEEELPGVEPKAEPPTEEKTAEAAPKAEQPKAEPAPQVVTDTYVLTIPYAHNAADLPLEQNFKTSKGNFWVKVEPQAAGAKGSPPETLRLILRGKIEGNMAFVPEMSSDSELRVLAEGKPIPKPPAPGEAPPEPEAPPPVAEATPSVPGENAIPLAPPISPEQEAVQAQPQPAEVLPLPAMEGPPTRVRLVIMNAGAKPEKARKLAVLLGQYRRGQLERQMGLRLDVVNVSQLEKTHLSKTAIFYRSGFMQPALLIAKAMPGDQTVKPMGAETLNRKGFDVEIMVGADQP